jgi:exopolysaccharide biosynthesis WecB/TagA/CpsF family protein
MPVGREADMAPDELRINDAGFTTVSLAGVHTALLSRRQTTDIMIDAVVRRRAGKLDKILLSTSMNGQTICEANQSPELVALFNAFDLTNMDGQPAVLLSRFWPKSFPERVATTDLIHDVMAAGVQKGVRHYLLGASAEVVLKAKAALEAQHPGVAIGGVHHGYVEEDNLSAVVDDIRSTGAEVLWVCMGVPKEQRISLKLSEALGRDIAVLKTGGGVLDFVSGEKPRAPRLFQSVGMEWAFRLMLEPKRLFKRYWKTNPKALQILVTTRPQYKTAAMPTE